MKAEQVHIVGRTIVTGTGATTINNVPCYDKSVTCDIIRQGDFVTPLPFWYNVDEITWWRGKLEHYYKGKPYNAFAGWLIGSTVPAPDWDRQAVFNTALGRLYDGSLRNEGIRGNLDLSVALGESRSTFRMFQGISQILYKAGKIRSTGFNPRAASKAAADGWLSWTYGWKPLLSDIFGAADESVRYVQAGVATQRVRVTHPILVEAPIPVTIVNWTGKAQNSIRGLATCVISVTYETSGSFDVARWASLNPLSLAWELTTLSFVADWFYDVGSFLRNMESALLYNSVFKSGFVSEFWKYDQEVSVSKGSVPYVNGQETWYPEGMKYSRRERKFARTVLSQMPRPYLPKLRVDLGSNQLLSAAALLRQLLK